MHEMPLPARIGGSHIDHDRHSGPPSLIYPVLRDLANYPAIVTIEIDTKGDRFLGVIDGVLRASQPTGRTPERIVIKSTPRTGGRPLKHTISMPDVLAFRVIKVETVGRADPHG